MGGSLRPTLAGHNPVEPAKAGSAIVSGPHVASFNDLYVALRHAHAMRPAHNAHELAVAIGDLWNHAAQRAAQIKAASDIAAGGQSTLRDTVQRLLTLLNSRQAHAPA
jgi:3-deoxy-D-manno-octulosonic-acid transferase